MPFDLADGGGVSNMMDLRRRVVKQSWFIAVQRPSVRLERQLQMSMKNAV
jgi:hypothetical protein